MTIDDQKDALHFLVAVDDSEYALAAVRWIALMAAVGVPVRCTLLNVQRPLMSGEVGAIAPANIAMERRERNAAYALEHAVVILRKQGLPYAIEELADDAATAVVARATALGCNAIVIGRRGQGALRAAVLGSVSSEVIRCSSVPVVVIGNVTEVPPATSLRVLVALDGSTSAMHAAVFAATLVASSGELHLLHVQPALTVAEAVLAHRDRVTEHWSGKDVENAFRDTRKMLARKGVKCAEHVVASDDAGDAILRAVREYECGMVAMGTRGLKPMATLLLGSVAQQVLERSSCPVVLAR